MTTRRGAIGGPLRRAGSHDIKLGAGGRAGASQPRTQRLEPPAEPVPGLDDSPSARSSSRARACSRLQARKPSVAVASSLEAEPRFERGRSLAHHRRASRSVAVSIRVSMTTAARRAEHPEALTQGRGVVGGVVERRVVDREIDAGVRERQAIELGLDRQQGPIEVAMRTEAVVVAGQQVDGGDAMPATRQPIREPGLMPPRSITSRPARAPSRATTTRTSDPQAARPDGPLPSVPSRQVPERQREQLLADPRCVVPRRDERFR